MPFADLALSKRLERAEGYASAQFADARRRLLPESRAEWVEAGGTYVVFDGVNSPVTQTFGLGLFEPVSAATLESIERFFFERGASADHEVSPFAGMEAFNLLCARNYRPIEISSVLYRSVEATDHSHPANIRVRVVEAGESWLWAETSARGWAHEHPEVRDFVLQLGAIATAKNDSFCFLGEIDSQPGAAGMLSIHEGVALFAGSATVPEWRRRGLQNALVRERMRFALDHGCDLAMMVAQPGSDSQRNAERSGFRIAYTRMKWRLAQAGNAAS